ncbi:MAG: tetratricopeptide repeat protein [Planctomycetaceae bacterium]|nr:tetratricopeptide repeat protein [Planctomycetaceae bacterium]
MDYSKHLLKADEALKKRNWDFAIEVYQSLLDMEPDLGEARAGLRVALRRRHEQKGGGMKLFKAIAGAGPLAVAKGLAKAGKHAAAAKSLEQFLSSNPLDEEANLELGRALESAGYSKSALAVYEFLAEIAPRNPEGLKRAGAMAYRAGEHAKALEYYERALQADPRDQDALKARKDLAAERALKAGRFEQVSHSREQIRDKDQAADLERSRRRQLTEEDLVRERERLEGQYAENPKDPELMLALAEVHEKLKDYESALDCAERAQQYKKDSFDLLCKVGDLRAKVIKKRIARADKEGNTELAGRLENELVAAEAEDFKNRVQVHPGDATLRLQLAKRLAKLGELDAALAEFQKAQADARVQREARMGLAQCFQRKGFADLAKKEYLRVLEGVREIDERAKEALYALGEIAEGEGNAEQARSSYARVYEVDIGYRDVAAKMERFR